MPEGAGQLPLEVLRARPPEGAPARAAPVVFVHGAFAGAWCWAESYLHRFAAAGYEATAFSFRGHGDSGGRERIHSFSIDDYAKDLAAIVADCATPPVVIAHSMGGFVAMRWLERALADRERAPVAGLALMASVPPGGLWGPSLSLMAFQPTLFFELAMVQAGNQSWMSLDTVNRALFNPETPREAAKAYHARLSLESQQAVLEMQGGLRVDASRLRGRLPIQVLGAQHDTLIPPAFVRAAARELGVRAEIVPGVGHGMMLGAHADRAAERIFDWIDALAGRPEREGL